MYPGLNTLLLRSADHSSSSTKALESVLFKGGHFAARFAREQVSDELLDEIDAVFLEVIREDDLAYFLGLRKKSRKPMLVYGVDVPKSMQIASLNVGADAFLRFPDAPEILEARVHAFLRRSGLEPFRKELDGRRGAG